MQEKEPDLRPVGWTMATASLLRWVGNKIVAFLILFILVMMLGVALSNVDNEGVRIGLTVLIGIAVLFLAVLYEKGRRANTSKTRGVKNA
jgi:Ca2+/Na+ antiporter